MGFHKCIGGQCILFSVVFTPSPPPPQSLLWYLAPPDISLLITNIVSPAQACLGFLGPKKKTIVAS
jgi:hypothetical protein